MPETPRKKRLSKKASTPRRSNTEKTTKWSSYNSQSYDPDAAYRKNNGGSSETKTNSVDKKDAAKPANRKSKGSKTATTFNNNKSKKSTTTSSENKNFEKLKRDDKSSDSEEEKDAFDMNEFSNKPYDPNESNKNESSQPPVRSSRLSRRESVSKNIGGSGRRVSQANLGVGGSNRRQSLSQSPSRRMSVSSVHGNNNGSR